MLRKLPQAFQQYYPADAAISGIPSRGNPFQFTKRFVQLLFAAAVLTCKVSFDPKAPAPSASAEGKQLQQATITGEEDLVSETSGMKKRKVISRAADDEKAETSTKHRRKVISSLSKGAGQEQDANDEEQQPDEEEEDAGKEDHGGEGEPPSLDIRIQKRAEIRDPDIGGRELAF
ncbi:hypothetical protein R1sor_020538 [Riccia sorocarpa]|uniref:Uncharacterized protein n=1 Tax=Riccia sorocarpa TaxID=122646 RepID=A0ABD3IGE0_9MARC